MPKCFIADYSPLYTPAVYQGLNNFRYDNSHSTGQDSHHVNTSFRYHDAMF